MVLRVLTHMRTVALLAAVLLQVFMGVLAMTALALAALVSERKRFETKLLHLVDHDPLTDIFSRRRFLADLEHYLAQARRYGTRGAVIFLDLDDFKSVNDKLGHLAGDRLLTGLAGLLRGRLRDSDLLARMGGDEFAVLLPHADRPQALALAGLLLQAIASHPYRVGSQPVAATASIGIALFREHGAAVEEILAHADLAMYRAKAQGGNCSSVYAADREWQEKLGIRFQSEQSIREALGKRVLRPARSTDFGSAPQPDLSIRAAAADGGRRRAGHSAQSVSGDGRAIGVDPRHRALGGLPGKSISSLDNVTLVEKQLFPSISRARPSPTVSCCR
jgi:diguanylate cyclase (GGDEF)-like protein